MGHQYQVSQQQPQQHRQQHQQRHYSTAYAHQQIYHGPSQQVSQQPARALNHRPQFFHPASNPVFVSQGISMTQAPSSVINAQTYDSQRNQPFDNYSQHKYIAQPYSRPGVHMLRDESIATEYEAYGDDQLYLHDDRSQTESYHQGHQQQLDLNDQQPCEDYADETLYPAGYTYQQGLVEPAATQVPFDLAQSNVNPILRARRRMSVPSHHLSYMNQHQQPTTIHHISQGNEQHQQPENCYRYQPRARATIISDEQQQQQHQFDCTETQRPIFVQYPRGSASQVYYAQVTSNANELDQRQQYSPASSSSTDIFPSPNLPLQNNTTITSTNNNRQNMIIDSGTHHAMNTAAAAYEGAIIDEIDGLLPASSDGTDPFTPNQICDAQQQDSDLVVQPPPATNILASDMEPTRQIIQQQQQTRHLDSDIQFSFNMQAQPPRSQQQHRNNNVNMTPVQLSKRRNVQLNPKNNPQEYCDMGTSGNVSQDWLETICSHLIEHMENFGICVIDNFLGSIKGEMILKEVHRLFSNGQYSKGRLVSNQLKNGVDGSDYCSSAPSTSDDSSSSPKSSTGLGNNHDDGDGGSNGLSNKRLTQAARSIDSTGTIRNDRVIWVDGCEDGCAEINNLIQTLCSVITNSSRLSLYTNNGLDKVNINKRTKAHVACYPGNGTRYIKHVDNPNGDGRVITAIYYLNKNWNTKSDGGLLRMFPAGMDEVANIEPLFDRALFFWSDRRNPHEVLPSFRDRFAITVWYIGESR